LLYFGHYQIIMGIFEVLEIKRLFLRHLEANSPQNKVKKGLKNP